MSDLDVHLAAIAAGDAEAFGRWMSSAERPIRASLRRFAALVDTEAVLQETLLRVWQVAPRVEHDGRPNGLLRLGMRIARNLALTELRRARVEPIDSEDLERKVTQLAAGEAPRGPDPMLRRVIAGCRERLPDKPAQALSARLESGGAEPDPVLAANLGMRPNTFLQNFTRARKMLADCLREHGVDLEAELA